jgi:Tol biopolymer transport system component
LDNFVVTHYPIGMTLFSRRTFAALASSLFLASPAALAGPGPGNDTVVFKGREIPLAAQLSGVPIPYYSFEYEPRSRRLTYLRYGTPTSIVAVDLGQAGPNLDLNRAPGVPNVDFSRISTANIRVRPTDGKIFLLADEKNTERDDLYSLDPATGELKRITFQARLTAWRFSPDYARAAYIMRVSNDMLHGELHVVDLATGEDRKITRDWDHLVFSWGHPDWTPDGKAVVVWSLKDGNRAYESPLYIPLDAPEKAKLLADITVPRGLNGDFHNNPTGLWLNDDEYLFAGTEGDSRKNLYVTSVATGRPRLVAALDGDFRTW